MLRSIFLLSSLSLLVSACTTAPLDPMATTSMSNAVSSTPVTTTWPQMDAVAKYEADRQAILAMAGDYRVSFDFTETVSFVEGYEIKEPKLSGAREVVRVIADTGDFISLQHILVVGGGGQYFPIKHWRQDWVYEPSSVLTFVGGNAWEMRDVTEEEAKGAWSQAVYQVDDSPRYGAVGKWSHKNGVAEWTPPAEMRPLPRRDMTTRDDYDAILAVNRHAITPLGWVHEQDNSKLVLRDGAPQALVREIGVNTYIKDSDFAVAVADEYWAATKGYWAAIRREWTRLEVEHGSFGLTMQGEPEALYQPLLQLAEDVQLGYATEEEAIEEGLAVIAQYTTTDIGSLQERLASK